MNRGTSGNLMKIVPDEQRATATPSSHELVVKSVLTGSNPYPTRQVTDTPAAPCASDVIVLSEYLILIDSNLSSRMVFDHTVLSYTIKTYLLGRTENFD